MIVILTWICSIISLLGTILNSNMNKYGNFIWIFTNMFWIIYDFSIGAYAQSLLYFIYFLLAIYGFIKWTMKEKNE